MGLVQNLFSGLLHALNLLGSLLSSMVDPQPFSRAVIVCDKGFPLSPMLFILMVESLSHKLEYEREMGNLHKVQIVKGLEKINHS
jgi:hypothetical protein